MCPPSWTPLLPPSPPHPSGSSQCTSPEHPVSCIEPGLVLYFTYGNIHVSMLFSKIIPPSPSPRVQKSVLYICVSFAISHIIFIQMFELFVGGSVVKNPPANAGDTINAGLIPGLGRPPEVGYCKLLQYFCLKNSMDRGVWGHKESDTIEHKAHRKF